jgi:hypothetical protein
MIVISKYPFIGLRRDLTRLGTLVNGIPLWRFRYRWNDQLYVGVLAQDVATVVPSPVSKGGNGYLRVDYHKLGIELLTWQNWIEQHLESEAARGKHYKPADSAIGAGAARPLSQRLRLLQLESI